MSDRAVFPRLAKWLFTAVEATGSRNYLYLTFDDGPDPKITTAVLALLKAEQTPATFFLLGSEVERHIEIARAIVTDGHTVGAHGFLHRNWTLSPASKVVEDLRKCLDIIASAVGVSPVNWRPPFGALGPGVLQAARQTGRRIILWSLSPSDYIPQPPERITDRIIRRAKGGDIILLHDQGKGAANMLRALPAIINGLRHRGFQLAALGS